MKEFIGELIGTFVLTLFGCGSVAALFFLYVLEPVMRRKSGGCDCDK